MNPIYFCQVHGMLGYLLVVPFTFMWLLYLRSFSSFWFNLWT